MKRPAQFTPGAEKLRLVIREIYSPVVHREPTEAELIFDNLKFIEAPDSMKAPTDIYYTARSLSLELNIPPSRLLRAIHRGDIRPSARCTSGGLLFTQAQANKIRSLISKP